MPVVEIADLADPRLADYSHLTDVGLKKAQGTEHGLYIAESALVLERALRAGHRPRSVLALGTSVEDAVALVGDDVTVFSGPGELIEQLTGYLLHRGLIASMHRPALPTARPGPGAAAAPPADRPRGSRSPRPSSARPGRRSAR